MVVSGLPHHLTQRGNRREPIFFEDGDQEIYRDLLGEQTRKADVEVWAYCLMPNHVHLILNPRQADGLGRAVGEAHRRYTNFINARGRWTGHLFQSRFASVAMDEWHLISAVCYVSLNPVRARLVTRAEDWPWSSVRAHINGVDDGWVTDRPVLDRFPHLLNCYRRPKIRTLRISGWLKEVGDRLARQNSSPASNDCSADPSRAALQYANPPPPSPAYN
jgi:putative transposase